MTGQSGVDVVDMLGNSVAVGDLLVRGVGKSGKNAGSDAANVVVCQVVDKDWDGVTGDVSRVLVRSNDPVDSRAKMFDYRPRERFLTPDAGGVLPKCVRVSGVRFCPSVDMVVDRYGSVVSVGDVVVYRTKKTGNMIVGAVRSVPDMGQYAMGVSMISVETLWNSGGVKRDVNAPTFPMCTVAPGRCVVVGGVELNTSWVRPVSRRVSGGSGGELLVAEGVSAGIGMMNSKRAGTGKTTVEYPVRGKGLHVSGNSVVRSGVGVSSPAGGDSLSALLGAARQGGVPVAPSWDRATSAVLGSQDDSRPGGRPGFFGRLFGRR